MLHETLEYLGIAFVCSVLLIIMSKIILQALIRRPADYYIAEELREEELMLNAGGISITNEHETSPEGVPMSETHLEAQLGDFEAAEPEEILVEIPESVHESIEVSESDNEKHSAGILPDYPGYSEENEEDIDLTETEYADLLGPSEPAPEAEPEPEPEPIFEPEKAAEQMNHQEDFGFSIKARTSHTRKPKKKEEAPEDSEQDAADKSAAASDNDSDRTGNEWSESYEDIRKSLEKAFEERKTQKSGGAGGSSGSRKRKPSMNMNRNELLEIADSRGIEVPPEATKREILGLIYAERKNRY